MQEFSYLAFVESSVVQYTTAYGTNNIFKNLTKTLLFANPNIRSVQSYCASHLQWRLAVVHSQDQQLTFSNPQWTSNQAVAYPLPLLTSLAHFQHSQGKFKKTPIQLLNIKIQFWQLILMFQAITSNGLSSISAAAPQCSLFSSTHILPWHWFQGLQIVVSGYALQCQPRSLIF